MKIDDPLLAAKELDAKVKEVLSTLNPTEDVKKAVIDYLLASAATTMMSSGGTFENFVSESRKLWDITAETLARRFKSPQSGDPTN